LRGNYRDKDMPRYDLNIAIFDTIRYIVPSLRKVHLVTVPTTITNKSLNMTAVFELGRSPKAE